MLGVELKMANTLEHVLTTYKLGDVIHPGCLGVVDGNVIFLRIDKKETLIMRVEPIQSLLERSE